MQVRRTLYLLLFVPFVFFVVRFFTTKDTKYTKSRPAKMERDGLRCMAGDAFTGLLTQINSLSAMINRVNSHYVQTSHIIGPSQIGCN